MGIGVVATRVLHRASPETSSRDLEKLIGATTSAYRVSPASVGGRKAVRLECLDEPNAPRCDVDAPLAILCVELDDSSWAVLRYEGWPRRSAVTVSDSWKERVDQFIAGLTVSSEEALQLPDRTRQTLAPGVPSPWESCFDGADYRVVEFREISSIEVPETAVTLYFGNYPDVPGAPGVPDSGATGAWLYTNHEYTASALFLLSELCGPSVGEQWHHRFAYVVVQAPTASTLHTLVASLHIADSTEQLCAIAAPTFPCQRTPPTDRRTPTTISDSVAPRVPTERLDNEPRERTP